MAFVGSKAPTTTPTITAKQAARYTRASINTLYGHLRTVHRDFYRRAYAGHDYTTAGFFNELGKDGVELLDVMDQIVAILEKLKPGTVTTAKQTHPPTVSLLREQDGTVKVAGS